MPLALLCAGCGGEAPAPANGNAGITVPLPPARPYAEPAANGLVEAETIEPAAPPPVQAGPPPERDEPQEQEKAPAPAKAPAPDTPAAAAAPAAAAPSTAEAPSERPPLPDATIAATIRRIGYSCPQVASAARMDGDGAGSSAFRITCSSGDAYRATVRQGRMRFRKL